VSEPVEPAEPGGHLAPPAGAARPTTPLAAFVLLTGLALVVIGAFLPWVWSGTSGRSSFAMVRSADRLGVVDDGIGLVVLRAWYLVPLLAAGIVVLVTVHRVRAAAIAGLVLSILVAAIALLVVALAPSTGAGPVTSVAGAVVVVAASIALLRRRRAAPGAGS
jgi:hypothetical protein